MLDLDTHNQTDAIPLRIDEGGAARVGDTQVTLDVVMGAFDRGATPEQIAQKFGELDLADVYSVIGYYLRHRDEVRRYLAERAAEASKLRHEIESNPANVEFRERLLRLKEQRAANSEP